MKPEESIDRSSLAFPEAVDSSFGLIALEHGLHRVEANATFVRYESDRIFLNVYHGRRSYEIGVEVGRHADDAYRYGLPDVLAALLGPDHTLRTNFQASTPSAVASCVQQMAELVDSHFGSVLEGDREAWERIVDLTAARNREYTKEVVQQPTRRAADEAWKQRNYRKVCELYESIRSDLSPVEEKRLEYALKHS